MGKNNPALRAVAKRGFASRGMAYAFVLGCAGPVLACPMCKDSTVDAGNAAGAQSAGLDFNKSIFIMLGGFVSVVGFTGRVMYKAIKSSGL